MIRKVNRPWIYLLLFGSLPLIWQSGLGKIIRGRYEELVDKNGLLDYSDRKLVLKPEKNTILLFLQLDLSEDDLALEFSKISFAYRWKEYISKASGYNKTFFVIKPVGGNETKIDNLKLYLRRFDMELKSLQWEPLSFAIETTYSFREKFGIKSNEGLVVFNSPNQWYSKNLDGVWEIYLGDTILFLNSVTGILTKFADKYSTDTEPVPKKEGDEQVDSEEEQTSLLLDLVQ